MAELSTLARPYAKAAFDFANEHSAINEWEYFLFIASVVVNDASFKAMLDNPAILAEQKAHALVDLYDNEVAVEQQTAFKQMLLANLQHGSMSGFAKVSQPIKNFVAQLAEQERLVLLPQVYEQYCLLRAQVLKQVDAYITSAYPLSDAQRMLMKTRLEQSLNASIILHESVDPSLLAGATIKIGDKIVDDSMRGKLKQLKTQLTA